MTWRSRPMFLSSRESFEHGRNQDRGIQYNRIYRSLSSDSRPQNDIVPSVEQPSTLHDESLQAMPREICLDSPREPEQEGAIGYKRAKNSGFFEQSKTIHDERLRNMPREIALDSPRASEQEGEIGCKRAKNGSFDIFKDHELPSTMKAQNSDCVKAWNDRIEILDIFNDVTELVIKHPVDKKIDIQHGKRTVLIFDQGSSTLSDSLVTVKNREYQILTTAGDASYKGEYFRVLLNREDFDSMNHELFRNAVDCVESLLEIAGIKKEEVNDVILVGGTACIPKIQNYLIRISKAKQTKKEDVNAEESSAYGATYSTSPLIAINLCLKEISPVEYKFPSHNNPEETISSTTIPITDKPMLDVSAFQPAQERARTNWGNQTERHNVTSETLKAVLQDEGKYVLEFELDEGFCAIEVHTCRSSVMKTIFENISGKEISTQGLDGTFPVVRDTDRRDKDTEPTAQLPQLERITSSDGAMGLAETVFKTIAVAFNIAFQSTDTVREMGRERKAKKAAYENVLRALEMVQNTIRTRSKDQEVMEMRLNEIRDTENWLMQRTFAEFSKQDLEATCSYLLGLNRQYRNTVTKRRA